MDAHKLVICVAFASLLGCDNGITLLNVAPAVTAIGPVVLADDGEVSAVFWLRDHEGDAVDIRLVVVRDGQSELELDNLGDHGAIGLTAVRQAPGQAHRVTFSATGIDSGANIQLRITPTDIRGATGAAFESKPFTLAAGLPIPE